MKILKSMFALCAAVSAAASLCAGEKALLILGWGAIPSKAATEARYLEAKDAGFTHLSQWYHSPEDAKRLLGMAERTGVKLMIIATMARGTRIMVSIERIDETSWTAACITAVSMAPRVIAPAFNGTG